MSKLDGIKIYKITFPNGKVYIGQTSGYFSVRKSQHINAAITPKQVVHKAIKKYGKDNLIWEILEIVNSSKEADEKEMYYIKLFNSLRGENGYNSTLGGDGHRIHHSQETKNKISKTKKESGINNIHVLNKYYKNNPEQRSLIQIERLKDSENLKKAQKSMQHAVCIGRQLGKIIGKEKKPVILIKDLAILEFDSISQAAKYLNVSISSISLCLSGKLKTVKNHRIYSK